MPIHRRDLLAVAPTIPFILGQSQVNRIPNAVEAGAAAGSPGTLPTGWTSATLGLTQTISGVGYTPSGLPKFNWALNGTTTNQFGNLSMCGGKDIPSYVGARWTVSCYLALVGGSLTNLYGVGIQIYDRDVNGNFINISISTNVLPLTSTLVRYSATGRVNTAGTFFALPSIWVNASAVSGQAVSLTLEVAAPQVQVGPILTKWVP